MLGEIIGDMAGSVYEFNPWAGDWQDIPVFTARSTFTDDTVLTFAVADALMKCNGNEKIFPEIVSDCLNEWGNEYPNRGFGGMFRQWLGAKEKCPYNSFGNGSAMRVSPVGWAFDTLEQVEKFAALSASPTHNHPEGIKGAQAVAGAIFLARQGKDKNDIKNYIVQKYGYDLNGTVAEIRKNYDFDETCQGSVPQAILTFLESESFEETIKKAIWLGGDADTQAAIAGSIAEAFYGFAPREMADEALRRLDQRMRLALKIWQKQFGSKEEGR